MALSVLTVEAERKKKFIQNFLVWLRLDFHGVVHDCTLSFFNSTFKVSVWSETDSSVSLTLNHSWIIHATCLPVRKRERLFCWTLS